MRSALVQQKRKSYHNRLGITMATEILAKSSADMLSLCKLFPLLNINKEACVPAMCFLTRGLTCLTGHGIGAGAVRAGGAPAEQGGQDGQARAPALPQHARAAAGRHLTR